MLSTVKGRAGILIKRFMAVSMAMGLLSGYHSGRFSNLGHGSRTGIEVPYQIAGIGSGGDYSLQKRQRFLGGKFQVFVGGRAENLVDIAPPILHQRAFGVQLIAVSLTLVSPLCTVPGE